MKGFLIRLGRCLAVCAAALLTVSVMYPELSATVVAHATPSVSPLYNWFASHALGLGGGVSLAMYGPLLHLKPKSYEQLGIDAKPNSSQPEYFPMTWFDSQTFTSASTVGAVPFFSVTNNDPSLSNMQLAGQFPGGEYFDIGEFHVDVLERVTAETAGAADTAAVGALDDLYQLLMSSRSLLTFSYRNKPYGPWPLAQHRPLGFVRANVAGAFLAATAVQFGGWDAVGNVYEKSLTIAPTTKFGVVIGFPAALTLSQASAIIRVSMRGVHYRTVN